MKKSEHKHEKLSVDLLGWSGAGVCVIFYILNIFGVISAQSLWYLLGNLAGGILLIIFAIKLKIWPNVMTNSVWFIAAAVSLAILIFGGNS